MKQNIAQTVGKILKEFESYRQDLVVAGGICTAIYHREKKEELAETLFTTDLDLATEDEKIEKREKTLSDLLQDMGFQDKMSGRGKGKTTFILEKGAEQDYEVEFLVPLKGSDRKDYSVLQSDLTGEKLRYIDLLLRNSELIELEIGGRDVEFQRPRPGLFIIHRALAVERRKTIKKKKKDWAYIIDIIHLFSNEMEQMQESITNARDQRGRYNTWIDQAKRRMEEYFLEKRDPRKASELTEIEANRARALVSDFIQDI